MHTSTRDCQDCRDQLVMLLWARRSQDGHWHLDHSCSPLWGVGTLYTGLGYNIASQLRRVIGCGAHTSPGCHDVPSCIQALCINPAIQNTILAPWTKRAQYRMFYSSAPVQEGVYIYIYSGIYSGFGYIADWGYPFVSLLPIHGITDLLSQYHVVWHLPCKACVLGISAVCLALTGSKDKLKEAILGAMKRRNPGVPWPKISLAHVCNGKMLQDGGTSCTNGGFSRARFRTDWHIPASRCSEVAPALTAFQACQLRPTHELLVSSCFGILYILYEIGGTRHAPPVTEFLLLNGQFAACLCGLYTQPS